MTDDLVRRLNAQVTSSLDGKLIANPIALEAAAEITRLKAVIAAIADEGQQSADTYGCANCNGHAERARAALSEATPTEGEGA